MLTLCLVSYDFYSVEDALHGMICFLSLQGRELLLVLLEAFVRKFHTLSEFELPRVFERA